MKQCGTCRTVYSGEKMPEICFICGGKTNKENKSKKQRKKAVKQTYQGVLIK